MWASIPTFVVKYCAPLLEMFENETRAHGTARALHSRRPWMERYKKVVSPRCRPSASRSICGLLGDCPSNKQVGSESLIRARTRLRLDRNGADDPGLGRGEAEQGRKPEKANWC